MEKKKKWLLSHQEKSEPNAGLTGAEVVGEDSTSHEIFHNDFLGSSNEDGTPKYPRTKSHTKNLLALSYTPSQVWSSLLPLIIFKAMQRGSW